MEILKLILIGAAVGMANVIPGVSGGTIAVVFNVYDRFLSAITLNLKKLWANRKFLFSIVGGMALGLLLFSKIISFLYGNFPTQTNFCFSGLIIGSIPLLANYAFGKKEKKSENNQEPALPKWKTGLDYSLRFLCICGGVFLIVLFNLIGNKVDMANITQTALPSLTFGLILKLFLAGVVGAIAMVTPGVSGSLILLVMGAYPVIMAAISALFSSQFVAAVLVLLPTALGIIAGILCGAKLISFLIKAVPFHTYCVILGLILGSIATILPPPSAITGTGCAVGCAICFAIGFFLAFLSTKFEKAE